MPLLCCGAAQVDAVDSPPVVQNIIPPEPAQVPASALEGFTLTGAALRERFGCE